ncbi:unnamed protein product [Mytilus edulis]|uniref:G-protein coupled receptors family 1 profile domain-containing protein n=1 Tax=Mytilus edulis TaxID=6550 RepID=A0A8S3QJY0_MYTED|nr:unnamed protein product [Mytilus edulis]
MEIVSSVFGLLVLAIYGVTSFDNTTYYDVHPEQNKDFMRDFSSSSELSVTDYSVEKIRYGNREECETTNLTNIGSSSTRGRLYPVQESGQSFLMWFNNSNHFTVDVSESCSSLLLENINMVLNQMINVTYIKDFLGLCQNEIVIRNILCDPYMKYNTRLMRNFIPYFSDVKIYFIDKDKYCTASFNTFVETNNNVLTNQDIYRFLMNLTSCGDNVYFTNQFCIAFSLQSISNKQDIVTAVLTTYTYNVDIFIILKYQICKETFMQYVYSQGLHVIKNDTFLLSIDNLVNLTYENTCFEVYLGCNGLGRYEEAGTFLPHSTIMYITSAVALVVILVNGFVLFIFLQKENRTPVTILLSALAISDSTTAVMMTISTVIINTKYGHHVDYSTTVPRWYLFDISECSMNMLFPNLAFGFHFVSILLTTLLSLQKTAALLFPIRSKYFISNKSSAVCSILIFICSFCIFSALISVFEPIF